MIALLRLIVIQKKSIAHCAKRQENSKTIQVRLPKKAKKNSNRTSIYPNETIPRHGDVWLSFNYMAKTSKNIDEAVKDLTSGLSEIKFGVLGTLDFKQIFQKKGIEFEKEYKLLEVCNPAAAKQVLESNPDVGLLLPCTIAVYEKNGQNYISLAKPTSLLSISSDDQLTSLGKEIEEKLIQVIENAK